MLLTELLPPEQVVVPLQARDKAGVIAELTRHLVGRAGGRYDEVLRAVLKREAELSTGMGFGVALPHGRSPSVTGSSLVCGVSVSPVPFDALDGEPVRLVFLLVGPEASAGQHVRILSRIARLVRRDGVRRRLIEARTAAEFHRILVEAEAR